MNLPKFYFRLCIAFIAIAYAGCRVPMPVATPPLKTMPAAWNNSTDSTNTATIQWRDFFTDKYLDALIDTALRNNQELSILMQEIEMTKNDIRAKQGLLLPKVEGVAGIGVEKVGRYTSQGAGDATTDIKPGKEMPEWLPDYRIGAYADWEIDIWKKLRNSKKAAITRYLATVEGKNFAITNIVAEIANSYYELLALDNQLDIVRDFIQLQKNALEIVRVQKEAARVNELAVKKFEAEVLNSQSMEYDLLQKIKEAENRINFLLGRYPQPIARDKSSFIDATPVQVHAGVPSQVLKNRPDIQQAELELSAAELDVKVARAEFYPSFNIAAGVGFQAFNPSYLIKMPESLLVSLVGDLAGPLINKSAIKAEFLNANAKQLQALYNYQKIILNAYIEVSNDLSNLSNSEQKYNLKSKEVATLTNAIDISNDLFKSARADYLEILMTQRDALASKLELIETKLQQFNSVTNIYHALGGGWN
ncbi:MAG TPA: TolC family protein [Chitinophagaceae bacterium]|jgi:NodT family efflux transporter outer membrane factor (OMF) lipoprotein|nr:TolC family protein [Chitinophagaceae bacterium]